jgi:hypothetical protein
VQPRTPCSLRGSQIQEVSSARLYSLGLCICRNSEFSSSSSRSRARGSPLLCKARCSQGKPDISSLPPSHPLQQPRTHTSTKLRTLTYMDCTHLSIFPLYASRTFSQLKETQPRPMTTQMTALGSGAFRVQGARNQLPFRAQALTPSWLALV